MSLDSRAGSASVLPREPTMRSVDGLIKAADQGLYRAKTDGRNRTRAGCQRRTGVALATADPLRPGMVRPGSVGRDRRWRGRQRHQAERNHEAERNQEHQLPPAAVAGIAQAPCSGGQQRQQENHEHQP